MTPTRSHQLAVCLSLINALLLAALLTSRATTAFARPQSESVLRGHALEIVDEKGVVRFGITVEKPTNEGGRPLPERVLVRVASPGAGPGMKIVSSAQGTALVMMHNDRPLIQIRTDSASSIRLLDADGKESVLRP